MQDSGKGNLFCSPEGGENIKHGFCSNACPHRWILNSGLLSFSPSCRAFSWVLRTPAPQPAIWDVWRSRHQLALGPVDVPCTSPGPASPHCLDLQHWPVCAPLRQKSGTGRERKTSGGINNTEQDMRTHHSFIPPPQHTQHTDYINV